MERDHLGDLGIKWNITQYHNWSWKKHDVNVWIWLIWLWINTSGKLLWTKHWTFGFRIRQWIFQPLVELQASQEGLYRKKLVNPWQVLFSLSQACSTWWSSPPSPGACPSQRNWCQSIWSQQDMPLMQLASGIWVSIAESTHRCTVGLTPTTATGMDTRITTTTPWGQR